MEDKLQILEQAHSLLLEACALKRQSEYYEMLVNSTQLDRFKKRYKKHVILKGKKSEELLISYNKLIKELWHN